MGTDLVVTRGGLPAEARAELQAALAGLRRGGGGLARAMGQLARLAESASAPLLRGAGVSARTLQPAIEAVMERAFDLAIFRQAETARFASPLRAHAAAIASGMVGGLAGLPGVLPDAAFTTLLILRNIAAIARENGEDPAEEATRQACLEVFLLGAPRDAAQAGSEAVGEGGYFAARLVLQGGTLVSVLRQAAARFGVVLSQKLAAGAVPIAGAAGGALVNAGFLAHYRAVARAHFVIRRLERSFGPEAVRAAAAA